MTSHPTDDTITIDNTIDNTIDSATDSTTGEQRIPMSYDEFLAWNGEHMHAEWVHGEMILFMPPTIPHQRIARFLFNLLETYVRMLQLGEMFFAPAEMRVVPGGNAREPDMLFVAQENLHRLDEKRLNGPADLVVEVVSPESVQRDRVEKFFEYQQAGIREYWLIDPRPGVQQVDIYALTSAGQYQAIVPDAAGRSHSRVLAGLWLKAAWLWQEPLPDPLHALMQIPAAAKALRQSLAADEEREEHTP